MFYKTESGGISTIYRNDEIFYEPKIGISDFIVSADEKNLHIR
jgi:hypothetical protein